MAIQERFRLDGKVAVVTGGSRGIGRAIALALADAGAHVVVASRNGTTCVEVAGEIAHRGVRGLGIACDVMDEASIVHLFDEVAAELGGTDLFVHAAGVAGGKLAADTTREDLSSMLDIHLLGGMTACQRAAMQMEARGGGSILLVTSVWGLGGATGTLAYGVAKAGLAHAVKVLAIEWARKKIRVNAIAPGLVDTDMTAALPDTARDKMIARIPLRRPADPDEMAGPALTLLSDAGSYITGEVLVVDGGERAR
jgi:NAD(P)-dependent dehydrogenase (short-subunit alcohol dehydrogenase family)